MTNTTEKSLTYSRYTELGGIINETDYLSIRQRADAISIPDKLSTSQVNVIAGVAGIRLLSSGKTLEPMTKLYMIMRADKKPEGVVYHHSQMTDQRLFAEALRILEDEKSLNKLIAAHRHISFS